MFRLFAAQRPLIIAGIISFVFFIFTIVLSLLDPTEVLGINRWIKPMKFFISISIFLWTIVVYVHLLDGKERFSRIVSWSMIAIFVIEMAIIVGQATRGTTSHFNTSTPLNGALFAIMGIAIMVNTALTLAILYHYFRHRIDLPRTLIWGMRLGLIVFILGSIEGGYMSSHTGHTIGLADGGPGLPLANWSRVAGDLRIAHFVGLHGLQAIPVFAYVANRLNFASSTWLTLAFAAIYTAAFTFTFVQALMGKPLI